MQAQFTCVTQVDELVVPHVNKTKPKFAQSKTYLDNHSTSLTIFLELFFARNVCTIYLIVRLAVPQSLACNSPRHHTYYSSPRYYPGAQIESIHQRHRNFIHRHTEFHFCKLRDYMALKTRLSFLKKKTKTKT